jgi:hypothetical protein
MRNLDGTCQSSILGENLGHDDAFLFTSFDLNI